GKEELFAARLRGSRSRIPASPGWSDRREPESGAGGLADYHQVSSGEYEVKWYGHPARVEVRLGHEPKTWRGDAVQSADLFAVSCYTYPGATIMALTISLPDAAEARLRERAGVAGQDVTHYLEQLMMRTLHESSTIT